MKINKETRDQMKSDIKTIFIHVCDKQYYDIPTSIKACKEDVALQFAMWRKVSFNRQFPSDNLNVYIIKGKRLLEENEGYETYPCGSNQNTLTTALNSIFKELTIELS